MQRGSSGFDASGDSSCASSLSKEWQDHSQRASPLAGSRFMSGYISNCCILLFIGVVLATGVSFTPGSYLFALLDLLSGMGIFRHEV